MIQTRRFLVLTSLILSLFIVFAPATTYAQTPENTPQHTQPDTDDFTIPKDLQTELPQEPARVVKERNTKRPSNFWKFLAIIFKYVFYAMVTLGVAYILYMIISEIIRVKRNAAPQGTSEEAVDIPLYQPDAETARIVLDDADKLASEGRFAEAVHTLLFRSIQDIEDKRPHHVKRSLTSREISNLPILSQKASTGFSMIGKMVEDSFFGDTILNADDYAASKAAYKTFAFEKLTQKNLIKAP